MTESLSLYLHIPFCDHRCAYCDFNAYAGLERLIPRYADAMIAEIGAWGEAVGAAPVRTVFFGGGTPSLMPLPLMEAIISEIRRRFAVDADAEWSLEANPGTVDRAYLAGLHSLGFNRLSVGVQSFDDAELRRLDRIHDAETAIGAYRAAREADFDNVSLDLIYGLEGQTLTGWERNVRRALALAPDHLSMYALTVEEGTPLAHRVARGDAPTPDDDLQADMYELAEDLMDSAGYRHYEISNWALPGRECRHNLVYWRDGDWLGLGAGAHSHLDGNRFAVVNSPARYIRSALGWGPGRAATGRVEDRPWERMAWIGRVEEPESATAMADAAILALRLDDGVDLAEFAHRFGLPFDAVFRETLSEISNWGLIERSEDAVRLTRRGRLLSNVVFARILDEAREGAVASASVVEPLIPLPLL